MGRSLLQAVLSDWFNHMLRFSDIVFGPIHSRRLGSSLGINLLPADGKLCNFDCIYCECGWNKDGRVSAPLLPPGCRYRFNHIFWQRGTDS